MCIFGLLLRLCVNSYKDKKRPHTQTYIHNTQTHTHIHTYTQIHTIHTHVCTHTMQRDTNTISSGTLLLWQLRRQVLASLHHHMQCRCQSRFHALHQEVSVCLWVCLYTCVCMCALVCVDMRVCLCVSACTYPYLSL
jgi:hypothetical protein